VRSRSGWQNGRTVEQDHAVAASHLDARLGAVQAAERYAVTSERILALAGRGRPRQ
jgi:hypothetical protein